MIIVITSYSIHYTKLYEKLESELTTLQGQNRSDILSDTIDDESIAAIISRWTNIPISKLVGGERDKLLHLEENMKKRVKGQDNVITSYSIHYTKLYD